MGAPHIQPKIYSFLKANPGQQYSPSQIEEALGISRGKGSSISWSLRSLVEKHPSVLKRFPIGSGRLALYGYVPRKAEPTLPRPTAAAPEKQPLALADVLISIPIGNNETATLTVVQARAVFEQLRQVFAQQ